MSRLNWLEFSISSPGSGSTSTMTPSLSATSVAFFKPSKNTFSSCLVLAEDGDDDDDDDDDAGIGPPGSVERFLAPIFLASLMQSIVCCIRVCLDCLSFSIHEGW